MRELTCTIALTLIKNIGVVTAKMLLERFGSATAVFENRNNIRDVIPDATHRLIESMRNVDDAVERAKREVAFIEEKNIRALCAGDAAYPRRLLNCADAPLVLYYYGNADLNDRKVVCVVGTRRCTPYGRSLCETFVRELGEAVPGVLVVSGLAYGVDVCAHRQSLSSGVDTVGILAHGLDMIYPASHRTVASEMISHGGLLTEHVSRTPIDRFNFVRRNRIVAGVSDACVVIESGRKGGSLITAEMACGYDRDVFAFPGRVSDEMSRGCNSLIASNKAAMIESASDFVSLMGWDAKAKGQKAKQLGLFDGVPDIDVYGLSDDAKKVVCSLSGVEDKPVNTIVSETGLPYSTISLLIFDLESKGLLESLAGNRVRLVKNRF